MNRYHRVGTSRGQCRTQLSGTKLSSTCEQPFVLEQGGGPPTTGW